MAATRGPKLKVSKMTPKPAKNRRKGMRGKPKGASNRLPTGLNRNTSGMRSTPETQFETQSSPDTFGGKLPKNPFYKKLKRR